MKTKPANSKLTSFVLGTQKKTRFQREKEERELKKKQAEQEAAKIYEDFVASFDGEDDSKSFVREGSPPRHRDTKKGKGGFDVPPPSSSRHYALDNRVSDRKSSGKKMSNMELMMLEMKERQEMRSSGRRGEKKKGQIDSFMEELKAKQEGTPLPPSAIDIVTGVATPGSIDDGDPETTNLYVGNLAPIITEETLQEIFGQYGDIYSVKIMWPRTEEERARKRNCGFVSYMRRADAEDAKMAMHDQELEGYRISVGWGKAIKKLSNPGAITPLVPINQKLLKPKAPTTATGEEEAKVEEKDVDPSMVASLAVQQLAAKQAGGGMDKPAGGGGRSGKWDVAPQEMEQEMTDQDQKVTVDVPQDKQRKYLIDRLARYVAKDGQPFEQKIREREVSNPDYAFLINHASAEGLYYRWKVWSLLMGDRERKWREKPFQMAVGGPFWIPPKMDQRSKEDEEKEERRRREREAEREKERERQRKEREERYKYMTGRQLEKARDKERGRNIKTQLSDSEYDNISDMLRALTNSRQKIKEAMGFALDNADCSEEIVQLLQESLTIKETPIPVKMARLYLLSDILHNSSAPVRHASSYRTHFQTCLPSIFESLNEALNNPSLGRMSAKSFEEKIMNILTIWEGWSLYPPLFINGLEATFQRKEKNMEDIPGVDEADLDREGLEKKAKQAGLAFSEKDSSMNLLKKLTHLNKYIKAKALGRRGELLEEPTEKPKEPQAEQKKNEASASQVQQTGSRSSGSQPIPTPTSKPRGTWKVAGDTDSEEEDVDGIPLGDDVDGVPLDDEDVDGVPLEKEDSPKVNLLGGAYGSDSDSDVDGIPMDESKTMQGSVRINSRVDSAPESPSKPKKSSTSSSRLKLVAASSDSESESESEEEEEKKSRTSKSESSLDIFTDSVASVEKLSSKERKQQLEEEEENRVMLRKIENEIMEYRDELERQGYTSSEIDVRVHRKRQDLVEDWEDEKERKKEKQKSKKSREKERDSSRKRSKEKEKERKSSKKHSSRDRDEKSYKRSKRDRSRSRDRSSSSKDKKKKKSDKRR